MQTPALPPASRPQIVTLTMNPALDITTSVDVVRPTDKLRCATTRYDPGGGGINVAHIAHVLGASVLAVFPAGGATGGLIARLLSDEGCRSSDSIGGSTRESFTVNERSTDQQYRFVLPGPQLTWREQARLPRATADGGEVGRIRGGEWQPAAGRNRRLLPAGRRHVPAAGRPPHPGHLRRRLAARLLRGVPP